jgi:hypothetical protein
MRSLPRLATLLLALFAAACNNQGPPPPVAPVSLQLSGSFALLSVNNDTVPAFLTNNSTQRIEVLDDTYTLRTDLAYMRTRTLRSSTPPSAPPTEETFITTGTYFADASAITFHGSTATSSFATFAARNGVDLVVTVSQTQQTLVYKPR